MRDYFLLKKVAPREGRVSRNGMVDTAKQPVLVAPREGRVSRNRAYSASLMDALVAPREGRVSRNQNALHQLTDHYGRAPRGACE